MVSETPARTFAIGDIHGCHQAFAALIDALQVTKHDRIITLGDYVDRGPGSKEVVDLLIELEDRCELIPIMGNHEVMLLTVLDDLSQLNFWLGSGGKETLQSYGGKIQDISEEHIDFFKNCLPLYEGSEFFCVHANYTPSLPFDAQPKYTLYWEHLDVYFPEPHSSGKTAIVGHTPQRNGKVLNSDHIICIDTYCYGGGLLTALDLDSGDLWQTTPTGELIQPDEISET